MRRISILSHYVVAGSGRAAPVAAQQGMMDGQGGMTDDE